jgi:magnesium transporter
MASPRFRGFRKMKRQQSIKNSLFSDLKQRVKKAGQPPGTLIYTGVKQEKSPVITLTHYDANYCHVVTSEDIQECLPESNYTGTCWIDVQGLDDIDMIKTLAERFTIHSLTVEDILNIEQRPKVEAFEGYLFLTLKILYWSNQHSSLSVRQMSIILGARFVLTFQESDNPVFSEIRNKLQNTSSQNFRQHGSDYLVYRFLDIIVDEYFVVLEQLGERIETAETTIIMSPTQTNSNIIYQLKHQMLILRKAIWPLREIVSHLLYEDVLISKFTRTYLRDLYDHTMQAIDTVETFRDILSSILDMYLSALTIRMNEIMKTLTIITTIFIPITAISSIYGMNLPNIPLMKSSIGFSVIATLMVSSVVFMMVFFRRKKWL